MNKLNYAIAGYDSEDQARELKRQLEATLPTSGMVDVEFSPLVGRWFIKCRPEDARGLYVRLQRIEEFNQPVDQA